MAQVNYTPISLYYSTTASTAPTAGNLANGELAINITDGILFYKDNAGAVQTLATKAATSGTYTSITLSGGTANGVAYLNGSKVVTTGSALTFDGTRFTVVGGNANSLRVDNGGQQYTEIDIANAGTVKASIYWDNTNTNLFYSSNGSATYASGAASYHSWNISSEQMRLTSTGLGIGTSSPSQKLTIAVADGVQAAQFRGATGYLRIRPYVDSTNGVIIDATNTAENAYTPLTLTGSNVRIATNIGVAATVDSSGNLGLGVTPSAWGSGFKAFENQGGALYSGSTSAILLGQNFYYNGANNIYKNTNLASAYSQNAGQHQWYIAPSGTAGNAITFSQAMTLDASGNLLVGTTTLLTAGKVSVGFNGTNNNGIVFNDTVPASGVNYALFQTTGTTIGSIARVGATSAVIYNTTSDYRLKTVTGAVTGHGARIDALKPVDYQWKKDGQNARGFLAHEFAEVYANSVTGTKDAVDSEGNPKYQAMQASTPEVIADLVAEIQSLRKRLADAGI